jgi:mannose-6-phosphate isomerase
MSWNAAWTACRASSMGSNSSKPHRLTPTAYEKIWGSTQLEPWFPNSDRKIGEFWFADADSPLLIKFLFTTENLSVQVHPNNEQARRLEPGCRGKTEMWHILKAEPDAKLAMGLMRDLTPEELRQASLDGSIMDLLRWVPAVPGETWFIPAGTIHAIGAGIALTEIQQNSDVTYRLYDYGRARELHLDKGVSVSDVSARPQPAGAKVSCSYFQTEVIPLKGEREIPSGALIVAHGSGTIAGEAFRAGEVWHLPSAASLASEDAGLLHVALPAD